ncbi:uncharacterized protein L969DRAFT_47115 [Mixia osmundae IAM 14324]|uniref:Uncharacterized protein n=1 Tax=Mixia osmundae (strain CBS 9802 / IAM 14324 / JCM 22182 / KY 12970) TaxID=764103 RepID=G7E628_MIXOS|nr:uncharacterized protein L969DRAFT_47115 [Mixia osmundae IAM 14324]KEI40560.1 hypothetical protein L969DRAFT_47115 [Mixia osmundae IAM 14324]GAA98288.1 hypothetical protein E5Q_04972 [Mixia osmundae IAM 14324]
MRAERTASRSAWTRQTSARNRYDLRVQSEPSSHKVSSAARTHVIAEVVNSPIYKSTKVADRASMIMTSGSMRPLVARPTIPRL